MAKPRLDLFTTPMTHEPLEAPSFLGDVPVLLPDARLALAELKVRALNLIAHYEQNVDDLKLALKSDSKSAPSQSELSPATRDRLEKTRAVQIHHLEFLRDLLSPLKLNVKPGALPTARFGYRLPTAQGLQGYFPNLVRDWSSAHSENEKHFELVKKALGEGDLGRVLVAGSGAGRLAYDVHEMKRSSETIACDVNVVLTLAAQRISRGETLRVAEFPVAPKNSAAASGTIRNCRAPRGAREGLIHILADVYYLPLADQSVDTVITPWLVDILPHRLEFLVSEINRVLKPGGRWINSGSFNFRFANWSDCLSVEEGMETISQNGFEQISLQQDLVPYLRSDLDAHERNELVTTFSVRKTAEARKPMPLPVKPAWLLNSSVPVPRTQSVPQTFASLESQAFVLSLIDGVRTLQDMATLVGQRYGLSAEEALDAVTSFLSRLEDDSIFRSNVLA